MVSRQFNDSNGCFKFLIVMHIRATPWTYNNYILYLDFHLQKFFSLESVLPTSQKLFGVAIIYTYNIYVFNFIYNKAEHICKMYYHTLGNSKSNATIVVVYPYKYRKFGGMMR